MITIGAIFAILAALLHVFIFYMESFAWTGEKARGVFGTTEQEAENTKEMAYNQGFYNFFLAVIAGAGVAFLFAGSTGIGAALTLAGTGSMLAAAVVLALSSPDKRGAAFKQGAFPLLTVVFIVIGLVV
ncbi:hypothetical protein N24_3170 [Corynebacterium suranareeae]|uniref:DUF1304 domain-containing protein n=1 Tax=Corynebacterium suranareeae TaxID=2506452 RepID=A0A161JPM5_9CORY|nr:DUF1304 family protein [Corynebacterium suranareeae]BAU97432.1 hypothetical protein N24_3170 [Corynebacterium suranareeae]